MMDGSAFLNETAHRIADDMAGNAEHLRITVAEGPMGARLIDAGAAVLGSIEAGLGIARATMGGLGEVNAAIDRTAEKWPLNIEVRSSQPVLACLASQYAGWSLSDGGYFAMGSGPARALARVEPLFSSLGYRERADAAVLVLETSEPPVEAIVEKVSQATGVAADRLTFIYAPTQSLAGTVQIVARVLEVALHKANDLGFPLERIVDGAGAAPLPAPHPDFLTAMGRTNDAIIYGGIVQLFVKGPAADAEALAEKLPSSASREYGEPFSDIFKRFKGDFYAIDPLLFSPAEVIVTAIETGETFRSGGRDLAMLERCLG
ncbi:methenyltetrahydromethanopterin cyclohydrolase [Aquamicrobium sp. LC103]|uniref:methenyltetrahydromethanopterin cyclohydrolase n=1 Tax=Aquamicrobium sp. LC103 TaxID=1120658 RepID=UPI00069CB6A2|nr:methenyltetrahydromethanopterin cyclohydrolase [Aquamicrobium sp. LC103]TKT69353.1 methenyltetrahydromethanopterin cyclohydrolase [Aquamicrobium sp. LC103]